jgi:hypothetical protein
MDLYVVKLPLLRTYNEKNTINERYLSIEIGLAMTWCSVKSENPRRRREKGVFPDLSTDVARVVYNGKEICLVPRNEHRYER